MKAIFYRVVAVLYVFLLFVVLIAAFITARADEWYYDPVTDGWYLDDLVYDPDGTPVHKPLESIFADAFESGAVHKWDAAIELEELDVDEEIF